MRKSLTIIGVAILSTIAVLAALPTFKTTSASGTTSAVAYFVADPNSQIRVVSANLTSDLATSTLALRTGAGAYYQTITNAASSSITNGISSTNGLVPSSVMVLQHAGACYSSTLSLWTTNAAGAPVIVLASGGWGVNASVGDDIYQMSAATTVGVGAVTNQWQNGDALYVGNYGRPVMATLTGTGACSINVLSAHYDSVGQ